MHLIVGLSVFKITTTTYFFFHFITQMVSRNIQERGKKSFNNNIKYIRKYNFIAPTVIEVVFFCQISRSGVVKSNRLYQ